MNLEKKKIFSEATFWPYNNNVEKELQEQWLFTLDKVIVEKKKSSKQYFGIRIQYEEYSEKITIKDYLIFSDSGDLQSCFFFFPSAFRLSCFFLHFCLVISNCSGLKVEQDIAKYVG